mgnify:CR=1 FL=1
MYDSISAQLNHLHHEDLLREAEQARLVSQVRRDRKPRGDRHRERAAAPAAERHRPACLTARSAE